jgi:hypothetical protein
MTIIGAVAKAAGARHSKTACQTLIRRSLDSSPASMSRLRFQYARCSASRRDPGLLPRPQPQQTERTTRPAPPPLQQPHQLPWMSSTGKANAVDAYHGQWTPPAPRAKRCPTAAAAAAAATRQMVVKWWSNGGQMVVKSQAQSAVRPPRQPRPQPPRPRSTRTAARPRRPSRSCAPATRHAASGQARRVPPSTEAPAEPRAAAGCGPRRRRPSTPGGEMQRQRERGRATERWGRERAGMRSPTRTGA